MMNKQLLFFVSMILLVSFVLSVSYSDPTVCCEVNLNGNLCVNEDSSDKCNSSFMYSPTACSSTSYCKLGTCYDTKQGICMGRTPKATCEDQGFVWDERDESQIPQCQLGCCLVSNEVAFTTLTRCRKISEDYGIPINYRSDISSELECVSLALGQDEGACVFESDSQPMCKRTTREECDALDEINLPGEAVNTNPLDGVEKTFYNDVLCSSPSLGNICTPQASTGCYDGQVYWYDSCGNKENVVSTFTLNDGVLRDELSANQGEEGYYLIREPGDYWEGACDVFEGTICDVMDRPDTFVQHECRTTFCDASDETGRTVRLNGESWCVSDGNLETFYTAGAQSAGSRSYRKMCIDGRVITEPCDAYRGKICYEGVIDISNWTSDNDYFNKKEYSSAACVVNRWQDCIMVDNQEDCENIYQRDCTWVESPPTGISLATGENGGVCLASYSPGTKFWESSGEDQCSLGSATCVVEYEASLWNDIAHIFNKERRNEAFEEAALNGGAITNIECIDGTWEQNMNVVCASLGDCGGNVNYNSVMGSGGYQIKEYEFFRTGEEQKANFTLRNTDYRTVMQKINGGLLGLNDE